ncbi:acetoin utilization protein AcuC [Armatimonas sp.]|uniref:acetoin utilization protein AcuC n=1 Tax=Armatimonas sp. TaxID=1872638 RepID=UPI003750EF13
MPRPTAFLYTDDFLAYDLGGKHPLQQRRLQLVDRKLASLGAFGGISRLTPTPVEEGLLGRVHTAEYLEIVQRASTPGHGLDLSRFGLGPGDTPAFPGMWDASRLYAGGSVDAAKCTLSGEFGIAFNVAGGLHHAHPWKAYGFCVFNDLALAITTFLDAGLERVMYVDIDVHHGDGVQVCHWDDPRVLTLSLHESGRWLFPGTGSSEETGGKSAPGSAINVPYAPYSGDEVWWHGFESVVPEAFARFQPQALVLQLGADAHFADPLAHLEVTSRTWLRAVEKLLELGKDIPVVVTGGGGYNIATVERLWTLVALSCAGLPCPEDLHDTETPTLDAEQQRTARTYLDSQLFVLQGALRW